MLHAQRPLSMSSTLLSDHNSHHSQYQLPQLRDFDGGWSKTQTSRTGDLGLKEWPRGYTDQSLIPSPRSTQSSMNNHQSTLSSMQERSALVPGKVQQIGSFHSTPPPPTARPSHSRQGSKSQPFYQSYYSARRTQSPQLKKENALEKEQAVRRKGSTDANSIASYLQIPSSINNSKGSLPEFAAQVSLTLNTIVCISRLHLADHLSILVRVFTYPAVGPRCTYNSIDRDPSLPRSDPNHGFPEMGNDNSFDDPGLPKRDFVGIDVCLSAESPESWRQRQDWK